MAEWYDEQTHNLLSEDLRIGALNEIKNHLIGVPGSEIAEITNRLRLPLIFDCLDSNTSVEQIDLACEVLTLCMSNLNLGESVNRYGAPLEKALGHPGESVKLMALTEILRTAKKNPEVLMVPEQLPLTLKVIECVREDNLSVGSKAVTILCIILPYWIVNPDVMEKLQIVMSAGDIQRYRVYEVTIAVACVSAIHLAQADATGILSRLFLELDCGDELLQLNALELITQLALHEHGLEYLEKCGVFQNLATKIETVDVTPLSRILIPGLMKFFGNVAHWKPLEMVSKYRCVVAALCDALSGHADESIIPLALDTIGYLGITNEGKIALNTLGNRMVAVMLQLGLYIKEWHTDVKIRGLDCLAQLLHVDPHRINNQVESITQNWFAELSAKPMELVFEHCKNPFSDIKVSALSVLKSLSGQIWGQELIQNTSGLVEFLLDRSTEHTKDAKEAKHAVVVALSESTVFDDATLRRLKKFVLEGPHYVDVVTEVAIMGSD